MIKLENVSYSYPRSKNFALKKIGVVINEGEFVALMGENGSGKTTFCRLLNGIIPHSQGGILYGSVEIDGVKTVDSCVPELARKVGMVFDDPETQLFSNNVYNETAFGPENLLLPKPEIMERVKRALEIVGLAGYEKKSPAELSGGEKQRLAIAAALAQAEKILVMDEPEAMLDPQGTAEIFSVIREVHEKRRLTVVMATHSRYAAEFADRICVLKGGTIAAFDTPQKILIDSKLLSENGIDSTGGASPRYSLPESVSFSGGVNPACGEISSGFSTRSRIGEPAIEISSLYYSYDSKTNSLENINLSIYNNDFAAIIGRNGCGKTTLVKNIVGLLRPSQGGILVRGKSAEGQVSAIAGEIGLVMQNPDNQLFCDTVYGEVSYALKNAKLPDAEIRERTCNALSATGLLEFKDHFPMALNRGLRTKTVIASVLAMGCRIIVMDEPDVGQDYNGSRQIMDMAKELHLRGYTIIFITHNMSLVAEYAGRIIVMRGGKIEADGEPCAILNRRGSAWCSKKP